jgi:hypothetical protein
MQLEVGEIDEFAAVTSRYILRALEIGDRIPGRTDWPAVPATHKQ